MVISINALVEPVGSIKQWIRPNAATPLPSGWLICDGSTVVDAGSSFNGIALPDLRGRFPRGHSTLDNSNFGADVNYFAGGTIPTSGVDSVNLSHGHSNPSHVHSIPQHTHSFFATPHFHNNPSYTSYQAIATGGLPAPGGIIGPGPGPNGHAHALGATQSTQSSGTTNFNSTATQTVSNSVSIGGSLGVTENRPANTELLVIIKVK